MIAFDVYENKNFVRIYFLIMFAIVLKHYCSIKICLFMRKLIMLFAFLSVAVLQAFAQTTVTGNVTDSDGGVLPGVSVSVKETTVATMTGSDGSYSIDVPDGKTHLVFSYIGMETLELEIAGKTVMNAVMYADEEIIDEVVVTALGISRDKKALGYSATSVDGEEFEKSSSVDAMNSLQGKIAGVNVTSGGGMPGASTKVIIRGYSSVAGGNNPLYVVDGVPIDNSSRTGSTSGIDFGNRANDINPNDIASMTILKGAAATAQYGPRGANGVVMITTKQGQLGKKGLTVEYNGSLSTSDVLRLPALQNTFGQGWSGHWAQDENGSWGPKMDGVERAWGSILPDGRQLIKPFEAVPYNLYEFYDYGNQYSNSLSLSGGNETSTFYLSYANSLADGIIPTNVDRNSKNLFKFNATKKTSIFSASANASYVRRDGNLLPDGYGGSNSAANLYSELLQIPRDFSIVDFKDYENNPFNTLDEYFTPYAFNPYFALNENQTSFFENRFYGNIAVDAKITEWVSATYRIGTDASSMDRKDYEAIMRFTPGSTQNIKKVTENPGMVYEENRTSSEVNQDMLLRFNKKFYEFSATGVLGFSTYQSNYKAVSGNINSLVIPEFYNLSNTDGTKETETYESMIRRYGYFGEATLGYSDKIYLNLTGRQDYSSTLPIDANSFFYPSASLSVLLNNVVPAISKSFELLKIRASWGQAGNDAPVYSIYPVMVASTVGIPFSQLNFPMAGVGAFEVSNVIGNLNLKPEITTEIELGTEMHVLKNRVIIDFSVYDRVSDGQILSNAIAASSGFTSQVINFGNVQNRGVELLATVYPVKRSKFEWGITGTFSKNNNKVLDLPGDATEIILRTVYGVEMIAVENEPLGVIRAYDYVYDSYNEDGTPADGAHIVVNAANGIPLGTTEKTVMGNVQPDYLLGVTNSMSFFKSVDFSFTLDYRPGGLMYSGTADLNYFVGNATQTLYNDRQPFVLPNSVIENPNYDDTDTESPLYIENDVPIDMTNNNAYYYHSQNPTANRSRVISRDYMKLRDISVAYTLPSSLTQKMKLQGIQFVFSGRNLLLFTPEDNNFVDPESSSFGNDLTSEFGEFRTGPTVRSFTGSIRIKF